jgi:trans-aconitate 2-methyltransferase
MPNGTDKLWDPQQYAKYTDERSRPFYDLVGRIACDSARAVVDLGCGTGLLTAGLSQRWPGAQIVGVDSSQTMLEQAERFTSETVRFELGDLRTWRPEGVLDVVISNAALQWVPDHVALLERFVSWLTPGGWLAFQVPGNFAAPAHRLLAELRMSPSWSAKVGAGADRHLAVREPLDYAAVLGALGMRVDAWETTYLHLLNGADAVLEWLKGTALRPVFDTLDGDEVREFLGEYAAMLRSAYPTRDDGVTPFPFRRVFVVAHLA